MTVVDLLFINGEILTLDDGNHTKGSLAVKDGKIVALFAGDEPPRGTVDVRRGKVIDLKGQTLIPGFIDTHNHLLAYAIQKQQINCSTPPNDSVADITALIAERVQEVLAETWIQGYGYDDTLLTDKRHVTKDDLDAVAPDHPVVINHISGHLTVANSAALQAERIDVLTALKAMTINGAHCNFTEELNGSLAVGKVADFAVLDANPLTIDPQALKDINVTLTVIGGEIVYKR